jgi:hypothetical protein
VRGEAYLKAKPWVRLRRCAARTLRTALPMDG